MNADWYERAIDLVREAQEAGFAAFMVHTMESGDVRLVGLSLPANVVASMFRAAADQYEAQIAPDVVN